MTTETQRLLIVDDDAPLRGRLSRVMERRGFTVFDADGVADAVKIINEQALSHAVLDMKLEDGNGLEIVPLIQEKHPECRVVMLTGFGNIATAVAAVKPAPSIICPNLLIRI